MTRWALEISFFFPVGTQLAVLTWCCSDLSKIWVFPCSSSLPGCCLCLASLTDISSSLHCFLSQLLLATTLSCKVQESLFDCGYVGFLPPIRRPSRAATLLAACRVDRADWSRLRCRFCPQVRNLKSLAAEFNASGTVGELRQIASWNRKIA